MRSLFKHSAFSSMAETFLTRHIASLNRIDLIAKNEQEKLIGVLEYERPTSDRVNVLHVEVTDLAYRGKDLGDTLMRAILDVARQEKWLVQMTCSYAQHWTKKRASSTPGAQELLWQPKARV